MSYLIQTVDGTNITITADDTYGLRGIRLGTEFDGCGSNVVMTSDEARFIAAELLTQADAQDDAATRLDVTVRHRIVETLASYIDEHGEISDDPDDINSVASAIWDALGIAGTGEPTDQEHLEAWADTREGYYFEPVRWVLRCLWCSYATHGKTQREAAANYKREHEQPILDRTEVTTL